MSEIARSTWQNIDYTSFHEAYAQFLEVYQQQQPTEVYDTLVDKVKLFGVAFLLESIAAFEPELSKLEQLLEDTYDNYTQTKSKLTSYHRYGRGKRAANYGGDDVMGVMAGLTTLFPHQEWRSIATTIGHGYPRLWRWFAPKSQVVAFDINPMQHLNWSLQLGTSEGADLGTLVDVGVTDWFSDFLETTQPEIVYLSNIVHFLCMDVQQVNSVAESLMAAQPDVVICTYPGETTSEEQFLQQIQTVYEVRIISTRVRSGSRDNWVLVKPEFLERAQQKHAPQVKQWQGS